MQDADLHHPHSDDKKSTKSARALERPDIKVLEWSSFNPHLIRQKYLEAIHSAATVKKEI